MRTVLDREQAVLQAGRQNPGWGQERVAQELRGQGVRVSASGVRKIWQRHGIETTYKRLKALERSGGPPLTVSQRARLVRGDRGVQVARQSRAFGQRNAKRGKSGAILEVAAVVFVQRGYVAASLKDIAERAGMLPGSIYHYFPSKQALFIAVHQEGFRQLIEAIRAEIALHRDPWDRLQAAAAAHTRLLLAGRPIHAVPAVSLFSRHVPTIQRQMTRDRNAYDALFKELIDGLTLNKKTNRSLLRLALLGSLNWSLTWFHRGELSPAQVGAGFVDLFRPLLAS